MLMRDMTRSSCERVGSQSAVTVPAASMPRYAAGMVDAIGITSSIGSPVNRTVLPIARSIVRLDPARYGVPGNDTRPSSPSIASDAADTVYRRARLPAAAMASVTRIVRSRALRAHHRFDRRRRQVMAVHDQAGEDAIGGEQFPDHVRMPRQHLRAAVAEVRRQRRAGGDRVGDLEWRRGRVSDRHAHAGRDQMLDERQRARYFGAQRDENDPAARPRPAAARNRRRLAARRARADARRARRPPARCTGLPCGCRRSPGRRCAGKTRAFAANAIEGRRDERRQAARDPGRAHPLERLERRGRR